MFARHFFRSAADSASPSTSLFSPFRGPTIMPSARATSKTIAASRSFHVYHRLNQYQRFGNQRAGGIPIGLLFRRWAQRPTFKYEVGGVGALAGGVYVFNLEEVPVSGRRRFNIVGDSYMQDLGKQQSQQVLQEYRDSILPEWDPRTKQVTRVLERLIPSSGMPGVEWEVHVIDSEEANAFVLPGGKVFVFSGILPICGNDAGVAAVLGHEIAHNVAKHSNEKASQSFILTSMSVLLQWLFGLPEFANNMILTLAFERPGSRAQESEADYIGLLMMAQSCYPPEAAAALWASMEAREKNNPQPPQLLSTHPSHHNRQEKIREWLPKARDKYEQSECSSTTRYVQDFRQRAKDTFL